VPMYFLIIWGGQRRIYATVKFLRTFAGLWCLCCWRSSVCMCSVNSLCAGYGAENIQSESFVTTALLAAGCSGLLRQVFAIKVPLWPLPPAVGCARGRPHGRPGILAGVLL